MENTFSTNSNSGSEFASRVKINSNFNPDIPFKSFNGVNSKPKGLAVRSMSHLNLSNQSPFKRLLRKSPTKHNLRPLSPSHRLLLQKQAVRFERKKELFLMKIKEAQKLAAQKNFVRPAVSEYPEPEQLAHDYEESIYDDLIIDCPIGNLTVQDEDEGFISDYELLPMDDDLSYIDFSREDLETSDVSLPTSKDLELDTITDLEISNCS